MPFSAAQKDAFVAALVSKGWLCCDDTVCSPSRGLWFGPSHFSQWDPQQMEEVFMRRAARIEKAPREGATRDAGENHDVHWAAAEVLKAHLPE